MTTRFHTISLANPCYLIAELSHNHQGDTDMALRLVEAAAGSGASAIKFQKRNNETLYSREYLDTVYDSPNSFGATYGEHREALEPKLSWLLLCQEAAARLGLDFIMTVFDLESLAFCERELNVNAYKIQSGDLSYAALIEAVAATGRPYFISCGAATLTEIKAAWQLCSDLCTPFLMMYAVSSYPTAPGHVNLRRIGQLQSVLNTSRLGFSCHYPGIEPSILARAMGCLAIEKHFTLDRQLPGPDHAISLLPSELETLCCKLRDTDMLMGMPFPGEEATGPEDHQKAARFKMGKSPVAARALEKGALVQSTDVQYISPAAGLSPGLFDTLLKQALATGIKAGEYFQRHHFGDSE